MKWKQQLYLYVNGLSDLGSRMDLIAFSALIFTFDNSPFWLMAFFVARQIGGILASLFAGVVADRVDRRCAMLTSDWLSGVAVASVLVFPHPYTVVAAAFLKGILYSIFHVSFQASIPRMLGEENIVQANALAVRLESAAGIIGFAAGGVLADRLGYEVVIAFDAATFFLSALMLTWIRWDSVPEGAVDKGGSKRLDMLGDWRELWKYLKRYPLLLSLSLLALFEALATAGYNYALPLQAMELDSDSATLHGLMWSAISIGSLLGSVLVPRWKVEIITGFAASSLVGAVVIVAAFLIEAAVPVLLLLFAAGVFQAAVSLYKRIILQQSDNEVRGRVLGVQSLFMRIGFFLGFLAAPSVSGLLSLPGMVLGSQCLLIGAVLTMILYGKSAREKRA